MLSIAAISSVTIATFDFSIKRFPPVMMYEGMILTLLSRISLLLSLYVEIEGTAFFLFGLLFTNHVEGFPSNVSHKHDNLQVGKQCYFCL